MIRRTLQATQAATFSVLLPNAAQHGMPTPVGTGFFVSPDGWFVTAAHVVTENGRSDGPPRKDLSDCRLEKETRLHDPNSGAMCGHVALVHVEPTTDFALLKVDYPRNANKAWLKDRTTFPHLEVSSRTLEEGEPVYSFGYPLSTGSAQAVGGGFVGSVGLSPRVTAAIVSSTLERTRMVMTSGDPMIYVLDRALNYGNSGGPIVAVDTGRAHAFCCRFEPVHIPQSHLKDDQGKPLMVMMPSLYGIVSSLGTPSIDGKLREVGVPVVSD